MEENRKIKRPAVKFTDREIAKIKGSDRRVYLKDVCPGLYLEVRELKINADGEDITPKAWYLQYRQRFKDIFKSERYWRIMDYLASPYWDCQTMMGTLPIAHYVNETLDNYIKGI